jgi:hypothetical protein
VTAQDHGQDAGQDAIRLEISPPKGYTRGRGRVEADLAPVSPGRPEFGCGQDERSSETSTVAGRPAGPVRRRGPVANEVLPPPLERRAKEIRADATSARRRAGTPRAELAAELDYVRAAAAAADKRGMSDPMSSVAIRDAITALRAAGDTVTTCMLTWRPES